MRRVAAAFALFRRSTDRGDEWLAQWNRKWQAFNVVGGHREAGETFRECAVREVQEELVLDPDIGFLVDEVPLARIEFEAWSVPIGETTAYEMELFAATLIPETVADLLIASGENRWLGQEEIAAGRTADGLAISEVTIRFYRALQTL